MGISTRWKLGCLCCLLSFPFFSKGDLQAMPAKRVKLPDAVGAWRVSGPPQAIDENNIFEYMDGAGELYLAFRFDRLQAYEYRGEGGNDILVELYRMKGAEDAFGLLSLDWGGEAVTLAPGGTAAPASAAAPAARALYGAGLLRLWSEDLYARVMAVRETPESREAVLKLGEAIVAGRGDAPPPALLRLLPVSLPPHWALKKEGTAFFRSHLVLNSLYYLSHENILELEPDCQAALAVYEAENKRFRLLLIQYADERHAEQGLRRFVRDYVAEGEKGAAQAAGGATGFYRVEDGWLGFRISGRRLALAFGCSDLACARGIVEQVDLDRP